MPGPTFNQLHQQRQQLVVTPQMRQSLHLLQTPIFELQSLVQQHLQENPVLEEGLFNHEPLPDNFDESFESNEKDEVSEMLHLHDDEVTLPQEKERHSDWEERREYFLSSITKAESLGEHLRQQLVFTEGVEQELVEAVIDAIDDDGYLTMSVEELVRVTGRDEAAVAEGVSVVQGFDPAGVGARDLKECLLLQLKNLGKDETLAARIVRDYLEMLGARKLGEIARLTGATREDVQQAAGLIAALEPKPGRAFGAETPRYVVPEVVVNKVNGEYVVSLNSDDLPRLRINHYYRGLLDDPGTTAETRDYIKDKIQSGMFLIKGIEQRQRTILKIANQIVKSQKEFLEHGVDALKPLTMAEVAEVIGVHETTVSRAVAGKYIQTPQGIYDIKYFFTPGYKTASGDDVSSQTIKDAIGRIVMTEDCRDPYSDDELVAILKEKGIKIARRTVTKYREALNILPSYLRKSG